LRRRVEALIACLAAEAMPDACGAAAPTTNIAAALSCCLALQLPSRRWPAPRHLLQVPGSTAFPTPPQFRYSSDNSCGGETLQKPLARSGHLWRTPAERRGPAALRQWLLCQLLTQAVHACASSHPLALRPSAYSPARAPLAFSQESGARLDLQARSSTMRRWTVAEEAGICHSHRPRPQLPT
jgi:hypothetical protein